MRRKFGDDYYMQPRTYILPADSSELQADYKRAKEKVFILKPSASSRGRGIRLIRKLSEISWNKEKKCYRDCIVQQYIGNPYLINGLKFDMRVYVLVTSVDPLRIYLFKEGLARFATEKYRADNTGYQQQCAHITNTSINSKKQNYVNNENEKEDGRGHKWSLTAVAHHLESKGIPWSRVWNQIRDLAVSFLKQLGTSWIE